MLYYPKYYVREYYMAGVFLLNHRINRQRHIYRTRTTVPAELEGIMKKETFDKARIYSLDKAQFSAVQGVFSQGRTIQGINQQRRPKIELNILS